MHAFKSAHAELEGPALKQAGETRITKKKERKTKRDRENKTNKDHETKSNNTRRNEAHQSIHTLKTL